jgi:phosphatidylglycerophosphate synthase
MIKYTIEDIYFKAVKKMGGMWEQIVMGPPSVRIVWFLANFTRLTPNQVTVISFLVGVLSALAFYLNSYILGAILYELSFMIDTSDGKLSRLLGKSTKTGVVFDGMLDTLRLFIVSLALSFSYYNLTNNYMVFVYMFTAVFLIMFFAFTGLFIMYRSGPEPELKEKKKIESKVKDLNKGIIGKFRNYLREKCRTDLMYSNMEQEAIMFFFFPILSIFFGLKFIEYGLIAGIITMSLWIFFKYYRFFKKYWNLPYDRKITLATPTASKEQKEGDVLI